MPGPPPVAHAMLSHSSADKQYILGITPSLTSPHLLLRHPSPQITIVDAQSLQSIDSLKGGHTGDVTSIVSDGDGVWSSGKDASVVRWDERGRRAGMSIKAYVRKPLPVLAIAVSERDFLVIGGTELVSSEAHILFWDTRNTKTPAYTHTSTHSDDITHLSLLPPTPSFLPPSSSKPLPSRLLLSSSTDGLVALSDMKETDEDEALQATANRGQSVAAAGNFAHRGKMRVWERSDMDGVATWSIGKGEEEEVELQDQVEWPGEEFKFRSFNPPSSRPSTVQTAEEERTSKIQGVTSDYLIDVVPSLGIGKRGGPMTAVGTNEYASVSSRLSQLKRASGNIVLLHQTAASLSQYQPSAYFLTSPSRGHADVVRSLYHDVANEAIYTGSEDGVLCGWSLAGLPRLVVGDPEVDDDGGDGRDDVASDDEGDEESEIEMESEDGDMDVDEEEEEEGPRYGPVIGGGRNGDNRKDKRWDKRPHPY